MPKRPCLKCGTPTNGPYCTPHKRDGNLPTRELPRLMQGPLVCVLCGDPITEPRGRTSGAPSIQHLDGDQTNNHPSNLALAHMGCNASDAGVKPTRKR
jgi:hypothetical protein